MQELIGWARIGRRCSNVAVGFVAGLFVYDMQVVRDPSTADYMMALQTTYAIMAAVALVIGFGLRWYFNSLERNSKL